MNKHVLFIDGAYIGGESIVGYTMENGIVFTYTFFNLSAGIADMIDDACQNQTKMHFVFFPNGVKPDGEMFDGMALAVTCAREHHYNGSNIEVAFYLTEYNNKKRMKR